MSKEKKYLLNALVDKETFEAFKAGNVISNNGLHSTKGNFVPNQPDFQLPNFRGEQVKDWLIMLGEDAVAYAVFKIALPSFAKYVNRKFFTSTTEGESKKASHSKSSNSSSQKPTEQERTVHHSQTSNIIHIDDYRKQA